MLHYYYVTYHMFRLNCCLNEGVQSDTSVTRHIQRVTRRQGLCKQYLHPILLKSRTLFRNGLFRVNFNSHVLLFAFIWNVCLTASAGWLASLLYDGSLLLNHYPLGCIFSRFFRVSILYLVNVITIYSIYLVSYI